MLLSLTFALQPGPIVELRFGIPSLRSGASAWSREECLCEEAGGGGHVGGTVIDLYHCTLDVANLMRYSMLTLQDVKTGQ
jgi:hypothetical protein